MWRTVFPCYLRLHLWPVISIYAMACGIIVLLVVAVLLTAKRRAFSWMLPRLILVLYFLTKWMAQILGSLTILRSTPAC